MKIGLIGNMNNNNFALMRYLRDLGADAHLLLYSNDGRGTLSHFAPECDTWEINKWAAYIHQTEIPNAPIAALPAPLSWAMEMRSRVRSMLGIQDHVVSHVSKRKILLAINRYDCLISSGIAPAALSRVNRKVDIFYPYACEVEFLHSREFIKRLKHESGLSRKILKAVQETQAEAIRAARKVITPDPGVTEKALLSIGVYATRLAIPMVYAAEKLPDEPPSENLRKAAAVIATAGVSLLHQARLLWINDGSASAADWRFQSKNTHWFIAAYSDFVRRKRDTNPQLLIVEYGPDVEVTKRLVVQLDIERHVTWLPKMKRKEIMWLLSRVTAAVGEFYEIPRMTWGGTGWEALASGKPLIQGFNFSEGEYEHLFGHPPPPLLPVKSQKDIFHHLLSIENGVIDSSEIGKRAKEWFNRYNGVGLAKQWLSNLELCSADSKRNRDA